MSFIKPVILFLIVFSTISFVPHKSTYLSKKQLQETYLSALKEYEGTSYAPYGETGGISCSTLVRQALIDAIGTDLKLRSDLESHPCQSHQLHLGCNGELSQILHAENLKNIDHKKLKQGDIAILGNSSDVHTLAYLGDGKWIHSDPITEKVVEFNESEEESEWTKFQVTIMRWNILKDN